MRLHSSVSNDDGVFYTDLNGLQMVRRKTMSKLPLQGNVYPMPTMSFIQDPYNRLSVLGAQPQGVASLEPGLTLFFLYLRTKTVLPGVHCCVCFCLYVCRLA